MFRSFLRDDGGSTVIEYAMIGALISIIIVGALTAMGTKISVKFLQPISNNLN